MKLFTRPRRSKTLTLLILAFFIAGSSIAQSTNQKTEAFIRGQMKQRKIPGMQVAVVQHGKIVFLKAFGTANIEDAVPVTNKTLFPVHSITKAFTGVAIMQLVEAGKVKLDAPISDYLDGLPLAWQPVTVHHLLTHTSGLPDVWDSNSRLIDIDEDTAWAKTLQAPVNFKPGEQFQYNQANYVLLGKIIEKITGMPFIDFIREHQLKPAAMVSTCFSDSHDIVPHLSGSYTFRRVIHNSVVVSDTLQELIRDWPRYLWTAVGLNTTAQELAQWTIQLQNGKLLKKESLVPLWTPGLLNDGTHEGFGPVLNGYGLGWPIAPRAEHPVAGPTGGGRAAFFIYTKDDLTIIMLTNLIFSAPQSYIDDIAAFFIPGFHPVK